MCNHDTKCYTGSLNMQVIHLVLNIGFHFKTDRNQSYLLSFLVNQKNLELQSLEIVENSKGIGIPL